MPESGFYHLTITPKAADESTVIHMRTTGGGPCDVAFSNGNGAQTCGPVNYLENSLVEVDCKARHPTGDPTHPFVDTHGNRANTCYMMNRFSLPTASSWGIINAITACPSRADELAGCESSDYLLLCAPGAPCCKADPTIAATARAVRGGDAVEVELIARGLGSERSCGIARLSSDRFSVKTLGRPSGGTLVAHASIEGRRSCFSTLRANVEQGGVSASKDTTVADGTPSVVVARAVRGPTGEVAISVQLAGLRPQRVCGDPSVEMAAIAGARRSVVHLTVSTIKSNGAATASARLVGHDRCDTLQRLEIHQDLIDETAPAPQITGSPLTMCG
jgi:hypothetical protein